MKRSLTTDHQISHSFKRVKISTSPGELRLDRDIEHLLHSKLWTPSQNENNPNRVVELSCHNAVLTRDPVDPLRLRLSMLYRDERWIFYLQMPRMYPHTPPAVVRVTRERPTSAIMVASSVMQRFEAPVPECVLVSSNHPSSFMECNSEKIARLCEIDAATAVYRQWSPISSLGELIDFLMGIPEKRREWWNMDSNRRRHVEQLRFNVSQPIMRPVPHSQYSTMMKVTSPQRCQQVQQCPSSPCDMEEDSLDAAIQRSPFIANRFDVGYERGPMARHWGVR